MADATRTPEDIIKNYTLKRTKENYPENHVFRKYDETLSSTGVSREGTEEQKKNWPENIYAENFSNHINPQSIYTDIQFRVGSKDIKNSAGKIETVPNWVSLNSQNNNVYFKDLNIVDNGGVQKLTLNLYDKDFTNLETVVRG
ncbi:MAG: hypothetical protein LBF97_08275, partial [Elusimicrobiota bacterium]|nr:hypothetical protein [Elusimicrobiota bacterium]